MTRSAFLISVICSSLFFTGSSCHGNPNRVISSIEEFDCSEMMHGNVITGTPGITLTVSNCKDYKFKKEKIARALSIFVREYSADFDIPEFIVWESLRNLKIEVSIIPRTVSSAFGIDGKPIENVPVSGLALSKDHIWVEIRTNHIWSSSLAHELIHAIIWRKNLVHGDPDHEGKNFSGWNKSHTEFIKKFNRILLDLDI